MPSRTPRDDVRKPPVRAVLSQHKQGVRGLCGWCGLAVEETTEVRGWLKFWHAACELEMGVITAPAQARAALFDRDKGICSECGEDWSGRYVFRPGGSIFICGTWPETKQFRAERMEGFWVYSEVIWVSLWHGDHKVPLWKVRHLHDLQRLEYFKLHNLVTLCERCHAFKTKREAAERAKFNEQADPKPEKPKAKWQSRKMQSGSRWPPRGSTPMRRKS